MPNTTRSVYNNSFPSSLPSASPFIKFYRQSGSLILIHFLTFILLSLSLFGFCSGPRNECRVRVYPRQHHCRLETSTTSSIKLTDLLFSPAPASPQSLSLSSSFYLPGPTAARGKYWRAHPCSMERNITYTVQQSSSL